VIQLLLEQKTDVNVKDYDGETALLWAARHGCAAAAQQLVKRNADVNVKDSNGLTALHWAAKNGA
jgi:ankyrin repeat protein